MGMFTWKLSDTNEPLLLGESACLVRPFGISHCEVSYGGHGVFGGQDAYAALALDNLRREEINQSLNLGVELRKLGVSLCSGELVYLDREKNRYVGGSNAALAKHLAPEPLMASLPSRWDIPIEAFGGATGNDLVDSGRLVSLSSEELFAAQGRIFYPLKIARQDRPYGSLPPAGGVSNWVLFGMA